jgi:hypothetical protein
MHKLIPILFLLFPAMLSAQSYGIESLADSHKANIAAPTLQKFMKSAVKQDFRDCLHDAEISKSEAETYFGAVKIKLSTKSFPCYVVFPSKYCMAFFGAHAIAYWLVAEDKPNHFRILYKGRSDGFDIKKSSSNGFYDFWSGYNQTYSVWRFNGIKYQHTGDGEYPQN